MSYSSPTARIMRSLRLLGPMPASAVALTGLLALSCGMDGSGRAPDGGANLSESGGGTTDAHNARGGGSTRDAGNAGSGNAGAGARTAETGGDPSAGGRFSGGGGGSNAAGGRNGDGGANDASAGASGAGGAGAGDAGPSAPSSLPVPPGPGGVPRPSGSAGHLVVLPWAGFKSAVSYTFDDSQPSQIDHYGDIAATGIGVTYYVTTVNKGLAGYDATWSAAARAGSEIGNHTVDHCYHDLTGCSGSTSAGSVAAEIDQCTAYITSNLGQKDVWTIAYPYGDAAYEPDAKSRFFLGRGVGGGMIAPSDATDPFNLPVKAAAGGESASTFNDAIDAGHAQGRWLIFLFHSLLPGQNWYAGVDIGSVTQSIEHGKALRDAWLDSVANVGAYWLGQKLLEGGASGSSWTWKLPAHFPPSRFLRVKVEGGKLSQSGRELPWDDHGYYEVALDDGALTWLP